MPPTGPRTAAGKAIASRNAVKHGLLSGSPLATPLESAEEWQSHREGILEDLPPRGQAETCLAERAALLMWRLRRVALAEVAAVELSLSRVEDDYLRGGGGARAVGPGECRQHPETLRGDAAEAVRLIELLV